jgi:hypothetical protein
MSERLLKKYLKDLSEQELKEELLKLYHKLPQVKTYYKAELSVDGSKIYETYKTKLDREIRKLYNVKFGGYRNKEMNAIIAEFEKMAVFKVDIAHLMLHRVYQCIVFINQFGVEDESYCMATAKHIIKTLQFITYNNLYDDLKPSIEKLLTIASQCYMMQHIIFENYI